MMPFAYSQLNAKTTIKTIWKFFSKTHVTLDIFSNVNFYECCLFIYSQLFIVQRTIRHKIHKIVVTIITFQPVNSPAFFRCICLYLFFGIELWLSKISHYYFIFLCTSQTEKNFSIQTSCLILWMFTLLYFQTRQRGTREAKNF